MISYRQADLLPKLYPSEPVNRDPKLHSKVEVHDPSVDDEWSHGFLGTVTEIDTYHRPFLFHVQDQEENIFIMSRDKFDYPVDAMNLI